MSMALGFKINADLAEIRNGLKQVRKDFNSLITDVKAMKFDLKIDRSKLQTEIASAKAQIRNQLGGAATETVKVKVKVNAATIAADLAAIRPQITAALAAASGTVRVRVDLPKLQADLASARAMIAAMIASVGALPAGAVNINVNMGTMEATLKSLEKVIKQLKAEIGLLRGSLGGLGSSSTATAAQVDALERQVRELQAQMARTRTEANQGSAAFSGMASQVRGLIASIGGMLGIRMFMQITDEAKNFQGQLALVTDTQEQLIDVQRRLTQSANFTGTELGGSIALYSKLKLSTSELTGASDDMLLRMTDITNKFVAIGGAPTATANAAIFQFSQALGKGKLNGDEFVSIMEGALPLAAAMAKGMGMTIGEFTKASHDQKITTELMINSLLKMGATADEQYNKMPRTSAQAMTALKRDFNDVVAEFDRGFGLSAAVIGGIESLRANLSEVLAYVAAIGASTGLTLLGVAIAKTIFAIRAKIAALIADRNATIAATQADLQAARGAQALALADLQRAEAAKLSAVTVAQLAAAEANLTRTRAALDATTKKLAASEAAAAAATSRAALAGRGLLAVLSGPVGLILTVGLLAAGFLTMGDNASSAATELEKIGTTAEEVTKKLNAMTEAQRNAHKAQIDQKITAEKSAIEQQRKDISAQLRKEARGLIGTSPRQAALASPQDRNKASQLQKLAGEFESGRLSASELLQEINKIDAGLNKIEVRSGGFFDGTVSTLAESIGKIDDLEGILKETTEYKSLVEPANKPLGTVRTKPKPDAPNDALSMAKTDAEEALKLLEDKKQKEGVSLTEWYNRKRALLQQLHNIEIKMLQRDLSKETDPTKRGEINTDIINTKKTQQTELDLLKSQYAEEQKNHLQKLDNLTAEGKKRALEIASRASALLHAERSEAQIMQWKFEREREQIELNKDYSISEKRQLLEINQREEEQALDELSRKQVQQQNELSVELLRLKGDELEASLLEIDNKWAETLHNLQKEADQTQIQITLEIIMKQKLAAKAADIQKQAQTEFDNLANAEGILERDAKSSGRGTLTLERDKEQARLAALTNLKAQLAELQQLEANGAANLSAPITDLETKIANLQLTIPALQDQMGEFYANLAETSISAGESGLSTFFMDLVEGSKSASDAIKDFAKSFVKSLAQMAAQALAKIAIFMLLNALTGGAASAGGGGGGGSIGKAGKNAKKGDGIGGVLAGLFHGGGIAGGAGAKKSYNMSMFTHAPRYHVGGIAGMKPGEVPAVLQAGEEVLTRNDPRHVANGGGSGGSTRIVNVIDPNLVQDYMSSASGERVILNMIERNAGSVRQLLR
jgi:tape measure domain-containing protein